MHFLMKKPNSSHIKSVVIQMIIPHHTKGFPRKIKPPYFHLWAYKDHEKAFKKKVMTLDSLLPRKLFLQMCNDPQSKAMKIYVSTTVICNESPPTWSNECYRGNLKVMASWKRDKKNNWKINWNNFVCKLYNIFFSLMTLNLKFTLTKFNRNMSSFHLHIAKNFEIFIKCHYNTL